jgi:hypothetical protein
LNDKNTIILEGKMKRFKLISILTIALIAVVSNVFLFALPTDNNPCSPSPPEDGSRILVLGDRRNFLFYLCQGRSQRRGSRARNLLLIKTNRL